jgi:hypothetical protein
MPSKKVKAPPASRAKSAREKTRGTAAKPSVKTPSKAPPTVKRAATATPKPNGRGLAERPKLATPAKKPAAVASKPASKPASQASRPTAIRPIRGSTLGNTSARPASSPSAAKPAQRPVAKGGASGTPAKPAQRPPAKPAQRVTKPAQRPPAKPVQASTKPAQRVTKPEQRPPAKPVSPLPRWCSSLWPSRCRAPPSQHGPLRPSRCQALPSRRRSHRYGLPPLGRFGRSPPSRPWTVRAKRSASSARRSSERAPMPVRHAMRWPGFRPKAMRCELAWMPRRRDRRKSVPAMARR